MSRRAILIEALAATPRDLARMARWVEPASALARPNPAGWCIADVVAHITLAEPQYLAIFMRAAAEERPEVAGVVPNPAAYDLTLSLAELVARFAEARAATIAFLGGLDQAQWARWLVYGAAPIRLREQVQALVTHDNLHLEQIATLREMI